ncbi:MAG: hypothetical protein CL561_04135 [Alphaproteobacteria bacterium]|nr:hypothetical protein [Alphaproteobacteria bacterium]|tara:strand:+ start:1000 stop:1443 length:444 start_codon:yes stop_codon:yes gene_type:complete
MRKHIIKLAVGIDNIDHFHQIQQAEAVDYNGQRAVPCWTRYKPKAADEILDNDGSIYRVVKNRIVCRHKILGFEMVETAEHGTMCAIMQDAEMIETVAMPKRAFQGWRYLKESDAPSDKGAYHGSASVEAEDVDPAMLEELKEAGLI